jgi:replication factor C subunit 3/5
MFFIDKYKPTNKKEAFFHKQILELLEIMSKDDAIPHIIFYGPSGSGKKTLISIFLEMLFDKSVHRSRGVQYKVSGSGSKTSVEVVKQSNYHIVIEPKNNNFDRYVIHDIVKEYAKNIGGFRTARSFKIVLINNIDNLSYYAQTSLRRTMEKYNEKCRFIMWCKSLSKVIKPLQSRCVCLRIPTPTDEELFQYIFKISVNEQMFLELEQYNTIITKSSGNIKTALWMLNMYKYDYYDTTTDYEIAIDEIVKLILELKIENIMTIRTIVSSLKITTFEGSMIMKDIVDKLCFSDKLSDKAKFEIVQNAAEIEYQLIKGRREIIQFDTLVANVMKIYHNDKKTKLSNKNKVAIVPKY